eukprot:scaffold47031_cov47-Prasinocladus_malaysianus.AAC.1
MSMVAPKSRRRSISSVLSGNFSPVIARSPTMSRQGPAGGPLRSTPGVFEVEGGASRSVGCPSDNLQIKPVVRTRRFFTGGPTEAIAYSDEAQDKSLDSDWLLSSEHSISGVGGLQSGAHRKMSRAAESGHLIPCPYSSGNFTRRTSCPAAWRTLATTDVAALCTTDVPYPSRRDILLSWLISYELEFASASQVRTATNTETWKTGEGMLCTRLSVRFSKGNDAEQWHVYHSRLS